jgi:hypothetical protein
VSGQTKAGVLGTYGCEGELTTRRRKRGGEPSGIFLFSFAFRSNVTTCQPNKSQPKEQTKLNDFHHCERRKEVIGTNRRKKMGDETWSEEVYPNRDGLDRGTDRQGLKKQNKQFTFQLRFLQAETPPLLNVFLSLWLFISVCACMCECVSVFLSRSPLAPEKATEKRGPI